MGGLHNPWYIALIVFNIITLIFVFVISYLSTSNTQSGLFITTQREQSERYNVDITPAGWVFFIWPVIYVWQALWILYSFVNIFRKNQHHHPVYTSPYLLPPLMMGVYVVANGCNVAWCFLFDRGYIEASLAALLLMTVLLAVGLGVSLRSLHHSLPALLKQRRRYDAWLMRGLVHNGLGIYVTWSFIASLLNLAIVITYTSAGSDVTSSLASTIALGVLSVGLLVYAVCDVCLMDRYTRYTLTPYVTVVVAMVGVVLNNWRPGETNSVFAVVLGGMGGAALLIKLVMVCVRHARDGKVSN